MRIFKKLKKARAELGLTQSQMAAYIGIKQNELSKLEAGGKKFVPNEIIAFLHNKGYDINTLFDDEVPLKKLGDVLNLVGESGGEYHLNTDKKVIKQVVSSLGFQNKSQLVDFLEQDDENSGQAKSLLDLAVLNAWESKYKKKFDWMERKLLLITELIMDDTQADIDAIKKELGNKSAS